MSRALLVRSLLTLVALGCTAGVVLMGVGTIPTGGFALRTVPVHGNLFRVEPEAGQPLPKGLRAGDLISSAHMTPEARAVLLFNTPRVPPGTRIVVPVQRAGQSLDVTLTATRITWKLADLIKVVPFLGVELVTMLLTLWLGKDWAAWGLSGFFLCALVFPILSLPAPPAWALATYLANIIVRVLLMVALFVFADALAGASLPAGLRRAARIVFAATTLAVVTIAELQTFIFVSTGNGTAFDLHAAVIKAIGISLFIVLLLLPMLLLIGGYHWGAHEDRLRLRWVLWSTALLALSIVGYSLISQDRHPYVANAFYVMQLLALVGYLYAVLRTRVVDVGFVVDRALVYGLLTALVFGTFSILEQSLHDFAVSDKIGWALQALAALVLALALSPLHRRLESWIEQAFFRAQHLALLALERLAHECPFVEREAHLLEMTIERLQPQCAGAAVYERAGNSYRRRAASDASWPEVLDADDPVFVTLRASHEAVSLRGQSSALGPEGLALPMSVAESMLGALICRPRDGEQFAPEMRAAFSNLAHHLGMAIIGLRHREHARLVADMAAGRIDPDTARRRAITLLEGDAPQALPAP